MSKKSLDNSKNDSDKNEIESSKNNTINQSKNTNSSIDSTTNYYNDFFETFRQNIQNFTNMMEQSWPSSLFPTMKAVSPFEMFDRWTETRIPVCDVIDRGDKFELNLEIPGIDKDKVDIRATKNSVGISAIQSEKTKEKGKNYVYSERSFKSFNRQIPFAQEILPSQVTARVKNGVLEVIIPKKNPTKVEGNEEHKVNIT
ncbi:MAG: Hsp20/alpha crystallin family protein [Candidatus Nitrosocosmicus sp.]|nr:Hsp20/alpha crystallin family protein [Candidatus Nitrosocosmicus sp.]MDN5866437.1 Hsp20/alpha crystallin family protein [Candidatus Nitrosocosmicus sp.]